MCRLPIPNMQFELCPGNIVKLHRFDDEAWEVNCGWFSYGGNKPMNGWYLVSKSNNLRIKPLNLSDLQDIYLIDIK